MEWQPISTAPKDGTWIWCYGEAADEGGHIVDRNQFSAQYTNYLNGRTTDHFCWQFAWYDGGYYGRCEPTHWQPLPPPPFRRQHD